MFPDPDHLPPDSSQTCVCIMVTVTIRLDFLSPELDVALWPGTVFRTTMPEAPIDEDSNTRPCKDEVCSTPRSLQDWEIDSIP